MHLKIFLSYGNNQAFELGACTVGLSELLKSNRINLSSRITKTVGGADLILGTL